MGSFSLWHWLVVLLIVVLVFGTKKLRNIVGKRKQRNKHHQQPSNRTQQPVTQFNQVDDKTFRRSHGIHSPVLGFCWCDW